MDFIGIPVIVLLCYLVGEILKVLFKSKDDVKKLIPVLLSLVGGLIGVIIFYTEKDYLHVNSIWDSIMIGIVSGAASTGTNQIIKQIFVKNEDKNNVKL